MNIELIRWADASTQIESSWFDREEEIDELEATKYPAGHLVESCGFLLYEDDEVAVLTLSLTTTQCGPYIIIPKAVIVHRTVLGESTIP